MQASLEGLEPFWRALQARVDTLARWRQHYAEIFDFLPTAAAITDSHGNILEANRTMAELAGREPRRLVGKPLLVLVAREDWPAFLSHLHARTPVWRTSFETAAAKVAVELSLESTRPGGLRWFARRCD